MELDGRPVTLTELSALGLSNYGHFTTMLVERGRVRGLDLHLARLRDDCRELHGAELDLERVRSVVRRLASPGPVTVRVTVFDPELEFGHPGDALEPHILVTARRASVAVPNRLHVMTVAYERELPSVKHVGLFGLIRERRAAQLAGFDDALFVNTEGNLSEGTTWNIGFVDGGDLVWPDARCLQGVTLRLLRTAADEAGIHAESAPIPSEETTSMRSAFAMNAVIGIRPVTSIDRHEFETGSALLSKINDIYLAIPGDPL